ncbi:MAG: hemolysin family protein [Pirellulaceae bacterium]
MWGVELTIILSMIAVNSVFAAYEIALASISLSRLHAIVRENRKGSKAALYMKENMEGSLAVVQLGITLVGVIAAATSGAGADESIAPHLQTMIDVSEEVAELLAIGLVVVPLTIGTIIFGELVPKVFALRNKEWVCLRLSPAMRCFAISVRPVVWFLESSVKLLMLWGEGYWKARMDTPAKSEATELQELRASVALARTSRLIGPHEEKVILGAAALSHRPVGAIMLSAEHISMIDVSSSMADALVTAHLDMHTRFPVTERSGDPQSIIGYVNFKDIVAQMRLAPQQPTLRSILRAIPSFQQDMPVARCLERMIAEHHHIALIRDGNGRILGLVTLEDMLEELVGEIEDEYDRLPSHVTASGRGWVVGGGVTIDRLRESTGIDLALVMPQSESRHLSEWVAGHLGRPVQGGEVIEHGNLRVVVRKIRRQKVMEAQVERKSVES